MRFLALFLPYSLIFLGISPVDAVDYGEVFVNGKRVTVCRVNILKEKLQLFLQDDKGQPIKSFDGINNWLAPQGKKLTFAMNAGMYHGNLSPVGLFVSEGKPLTELNTAQAEGNFFLKPNGVFLITGNGARVIETSEYLTVKQSVILATQSGPLLMRKGVIHPAFNESGTSRLYRNGVGVPSLDIAIFAISEEPVNFYEFATMFRDLLQCPDALFFDGTVSSLFSTQLKRNDRKMDLGPIIGITE
ncbi:phosphodiester glycosidase family protein [soil metagenome]